MADTLSFTQKFRAIKALDQDVSIRMDHCGQWFVSSRIERKEPGVLVSGGGHCDGIGESINSWWKENVEDLAHDRYLVVDAYTDNRRAVRWNGFMWEPVTEAEKVEA